MVATLRDGSSVRLRPVARDDEPGLRALLDRLSPESRRLRFFAADPDLDRKAGWAASRGAGRGFGLVATAGRIVGHAAWVRDGRDCAEIAFEVEDALQGRGLGTLLLAQLIEAARSAGLRRLTALVHPDNARMAALLRHCPLTAGEARGPGELRFTLELPTDTRRLP